MHELLKHKCILIELINAARSHHNNAPISPLYNKTYYECYTPPIDNNGWHKLEYHVGIYHEQNTHIIQLHAHTKQIKIERKPT
jgi:hypothetical protein